MLTEKTLTEIYDHHSREIFIYILRMLHDREQAEDLLHDCFVSLITYSEKYPVDETSIRAFLYRTAHNLTVNYIKRHGRISFTPLEDEYTNRDTTPEDSLFADEMEQRIDRVISECDPESARIFLMRKDMGMEIEAIAKELGVSERTVRRRIKSVIDQVMQVLNSEGFLTGMFFILSFFLLLIVSLTEGFHG